MSTDLPMLHKRIFASYSRSDADIVVPLCERLTDAGFPIWLDQNEMGAGARIGQVIDAALAESVAFIAFVGPNYFKDDHYTKDEYYAAMSLARSVPQWRQIIVQLDPSVPIPPLSKDLLRIDYDTQDRTIAALLGALARVTKVDEPMRPGSTAPTSIRIDELSERDLRLCAKGILAQRGELLRHGGDMPTFVIRLDATRSVRFAVLRDILQDIGTRSEIEYELRIIEVGQRTIDSVRHKLVLGLTGEFEAGFQLLLEERQSELVGAHEALKRHLTEITEMPAIVRTDEISAASSLNGSQNKKF